MMPVPHHSNVSETDAMLPQQLINNSFFIYLDDLAVFVADFSSHMRHLEEVFRKYHCFQQKVTYLCHVISEEGVVTDLAKKVAVKDTPVLQTVKQIKSFLSFPGY